MASRSRADLERLLKGVSRSFYLTLHALPARVRPQIGLAYLLARASDTIADTDALPAAQRLSALDCFRQNIVLHAQAEAPREQGRLPGLDQLAGQQSSAEERALLQRVPEVLAALAAFAPADRDRIQAVLEIIISGQALDVQRFATAEPEHIAALATDAELDDYTYRVAGCVGEFWTHMCRVHVFPRAPLDDQALLRDGVRFGKGLQLVNILRDLPVDLRLGRCYVPLPSLAEAGLGPADLLKASNMRRFKPVYGGYLRRAEEHLEAGWAYTNALPWRAVRVRLACAWPILIGLQTLAKLRQANVLDATQRVKISRAEVQHILLASVVRYPFRRAWRELGAGVH